MQTIETSERNFYEIAQRQLHSGHRSRVTNLATSAKAKCYVATENTQENPITCWREHHEEAKISQKPLSPVRRLLCEYGQRLS